MPLNSRGRKLRWEQQQSLLRISSSTGLVLQAQPPLQSIGTNFNNCFQPTLKDLVYGQKKINDKISKKFLANDKIIESMAAQLEGFNSVIKNQLSFNKMIESQVAQLASSCPNVNTGKLPVQTEVTSKENISAVTTRGDKTTQEPPFPQDAGKQRKTITASHTEVEDEVQEEAVESNTSATQEDPV